MQSAVCRRSSSAHRVLVAAQGAKTDGEALLTFKANVDELSRLCAGRSEDEALLKKLNARLHTLEGSVLQRVLTECRYREEWREARSARALSALSSSDVEPAAVDRAREYVSMLAPSPATVEVEATVPWQRELLRQQHALASVLQLCPSQSPELVQQTLSHFMSNSHTRLNQQLDHVADRIDSLHAQRAGGCAATSADASDAAAAADGDGVGVGSKDARALTPEAFLEVLRHQHRAVCTIQAHQRTATQRRLFLRQQSERRAAALRLQCGARMLAARRALHALREAQREKRRRALRQLHSAVRLQRAWRWSRRCARARDVWQRRAAARGADEDAEWRRWVKMSLLPRASSPTGFSAYSQYIESARLKEVRQRKEDAAVMLQSHGRGHRGRREARARRAAAVTVQAAARVWRARWRRRWWRRQLRRLHAARASRFQWEAFRCTARALLPLQRHAILAQLHVHKEVEAVQRDAVREKEEFETAFHRWATKTQRQALAKKLHADWIPQMDASTGASYYFNLKTGESTEENPNLRQARATERKQRAQGEQELEKRLARLEKYELQLRQGLEDQLDRCEQSLLQRLNEHMQQWRGATCYPLYFQRSQPPPAAPVPPGRRRAAW